MLYKISIWYVSNSRKIKFYWNCRKNITLNNSCICNIWNDASWIIKDINHPSTWIFIFSYSPLYVITRALLSFCWNLCDILFTRISFKISIGRSKVRSKGLKFDTCCVRDSLKTFCALLSFLPSLYKFYAASIFIVSFILLWIRFSRW